MATRFAYATEDTPVGPIGLIADDGGLIHAGFERLNRRSVEVVLGTTAESAVLEEYQAGASGRAQIEVRRAIAALRRYFDGDLASLGAIKVNPKGTLFQRKVWDALREIRPGTTWSYSELAERLDNPAAVRAVGSACKNNPVCLVIPCHRVIGKNKSLTGFAGGLETKAALLRHEGSLL